MSNPNPLVLQTKEKQYWKIKKICKKSGQISPKLDLGY